MLFLNHPPFSSIISPKSCTPCIFPTDLVSNEIPAATFGFAIKSYACFVVVSEEKIRDMLPSLKT